MRCMREPGPPRSVPDRGSQSYDFSHRFERPYSEIEARIKHRADDAEECAAASINFAPMVIDDAEIATLEAIDARAYAESLD